MSNFWSSGSGAEVSGSPEAAFLKDFSVIPDGTLALALIKSFGLVDKTDQYGVKKYYEIIWKITSNDYKNREVSQKIKVFDGKPEAIDRNLNMLKLVMDLCQFKPKHSDAPSDDDLRPMCGKILGIKISEWSMPKADGSGLMEGNYVPEVYAAASFVPSVGVKLEVVHTPSAGGDSALTRNSRVTIQDLDQDLPF